MNPLFSQLRLDRPLAVLDLETTSLSLSAARIIDVAVLQLLPGGPRPVVRRAAQRRFQKGVGS